MDDAAMQRQQKQMEEQRREANSSFPEAAGKFVSHNNK